MTFVGLLAAGIVITISTALRVWNRAMRMADLQQEARAVMGLLSRDIRGAYLGLPPDATGYFLGGVAEAAAGAAASPVDTLELTTESSALAEVALLPDQVREDWDQQVRPPVTDLVGVRWEWRAAEGPRPAGLYRVAAVVPSPEPEVDLDTGLQFGQVADELISTQVADLRFRYFDGAAWQENWDWREAGYSLPEAVSVDLTLREEPAGAGRRVQDYGFRTVVPIATR